MLFAGFGVVADALVAEDLRIVGDHGVRFFGRRGEEVRVVGEVVEAVDGSEGHHLVHRDRDGLGVGAAVAVGHCNCDRIAAGALRLGGRPGEDATCGDRSTGGSTRAE